MFTTSYSTAGTRMTSSHKRTYFHVTVQDHQEARKYFLVPRLSEQDDNDDVSVETVTSHPDRKTLHNDHHVTSTFYLPDRESREDTERRWKNKDASSLITVGFSHSMRPSGFSESVSVTDGPPCQQTSVATFCEREGSERYKEGVNIGPGLSPVWFQSAIICHSNNSKKNFRTSIDYVSKMKPLRYESTRYVRPKHTQTTYVSYVDYMSNDSQRYYTSAVHFVPGSSHTSTVHNFQMRHRINSVSSDDDADNEIISDADNDVTINVFNERMTLQRFNQPPLLISSAPEEDVYGNPNKLRMSHRTKMVVKSAPTQRMNAEDYFIYLSGYASTGDVIKNGYSIDGDEDNGYLSDDVTEV